MLQYLLYDDLALDDDIPEPSVSSSQIGAAISIPGPGSTIAGVGDDTDDTDAPVFTLLCSQFGLALAHRPPTAAPYAGRHLARVVDTTRTVLVPIAVTDPTVALLERTLTALRAW